MNKKYVPLLSLAMCLSFGLSACGGTQENLMVAFDDRIDYLDATYNEECDLSLYVTKRDGYIYSLEAVQVDVENGMKTVKLKTEGLKFTPTLFDDAFVTLVAKKGNSVGKSKEIKIPVVRPKDPIVEGITTSWHDSMFTVSVNSDPMYIKGEKSTSTKVAWFGSEPTVKDRFQYFATLMGDEITDNYSVTNWEDAVISFWVYNPTDYALEFAPIWSHSGAELVLETDPRTYKQASPHAWTEIKYSLAYYGITENFFYDDAVYKSYATDSVQWGIGTATNGKPAINQNWWTVRWGGRADVGVAYDYEFYASDFDIRNYDAVNDSDIDHDLNKFDRTFKYAEDTLTALSKPVQSKDKVRFEVKPYGNGITRFCFIKDWNQEYLGYFELDVNNSASNSAGVTVELKVGTTDTYIVTVDLSYGSFNDGATTETEFANIFFSSPEAKALLGSVEIIEGEYTEELRIVPSKNVTLEYEANKGTPKGISFEYKINNDGHIGLCFPDLSWNNYFGYFDIYNAEGKNDAHNGITYETLEDGYIRFTADFSSINKIIGSSMGDVGCMFIRGDYTDADGYIRNVIWTY